MNPLISKTILIKALEKWGAETQTEKIQEESMELALALHKYRCPTKDKKKCMDEIHDELADMEIMLEQAKMIFDWNKVNERIKFKMNRLGEYLEDYIDNNSERPQSDGIYETIDSKGNPVKTLFHSGQWQIYPGKNPVYKWLKQ